MANFSGYQLTKKGLTLQAKAQSGIALKYTKIKVGDGVLPSGSSIDELSDLISSRMELNPIAAEAVGDGTARVRATLSNAGLDSGFILREIGVFASDPEEGEILYAYTTAGSEGDPIPAGGGTTAIERVVEAVIIVGQATNIQFQVKSGTYITIEELEKYTNLTQFQAHVNEFQDHIRVNRVRKNSEAVQVGDIRYPSVLSAASYLLLECTSAGTTGTVEPAWGDVGSTITDGTAQWQVCTIQDTSVGTSQGRRVVLGEDELIPYDLMGNLAINEVGSGYMVRKYPDGFMELMGQFSMTSQAQTFTLPVSFASVPYGFAQTTDIGSLESVVRTFTCISLTTTTLRVTTNSTPSTDSFMYFARGYWK